MGTSDEIGGGGGGGPGNFLFENQTWASVFSSINSDNSGGKRSRGGAKSSTGKGTSGGGDWNECKLGGESDHEIHIWTERERRKKMRNMFSNLHALLPQLPAKADKSTIVDEAVNYIKTLQHSLQKLQKQRLEMLRGGGGGGPTLTTPTVIDYEPSSSSLVVASNSPTLNTREAFLADQAGPSSASMNNNSSSSMINDNMTFSSAAPNNSLSVVPCINNIPSTFQTWSSPNVVLSVNGDDAQISVCAPRKPGLLTTCCYVLEKHKLEVVTAHVSSDCYRSMFMIHAHANGACDQFPEPLPVEEIYKLAVGEMIFWLNS
ncbi:hypothetical protein C5167_016880 [Papaver somniferum]|uniref:BHLH domain-containing protein n=1 Tax=Papaver somniferum TaxID=3469 RepID=A0A4Y7IHU5_PAPSO|nr:hypothetical protein C5167_016880 [Papaver somniferum]